jgi:DNA polymerase-1
VFANHGIEVQGYVHDTMLQSYVLEVHKPHGLASLAERHLGRSGISYEDLCGKGAHQIPFAQVPTWPRRRIFGCEDSDQTLDVHRALWPQPAGRRQAARIYELEIASSEVLYRIERNGVLIDAPTLAAQSHELGQRIMQLEHEAHELAGQPFNLGSAQADRRDLLRQAGPAGHQENRHGASQHRRGSAGKTGRGLPAAGRILEHRGLAKLKGTYTDKLPQLADPRTAAASSPTTRRRWR